jgi:hypothetical protein
MSTESAPPTVVRANGTNGLAVASLVTGILSLVFFWGGWLFVAMAAAAIFTGIKGAQAAVAGKGQRGLATAGLVLGVIAAILEFIFLASVGTP